MFEEIIKRKYYAMKHINAPLLEERIKYIQCWIDTGHSISTIKSVANYLLRIIEFLSLTNTKRIVSLEELKIAANKWANYECNHPQKHSFAKTSTKRFMKFAVGWLKQMDWLEQLPEEKYPLFAKIFNRGHAVRRHIKAPLINERLQYLYYWEDNGCSLNNLKRIAQYLLVVIDLLNLHELRMVTMEEILVAADIWANDNRIKLRKNGYSKFARKRFICDTSRWLDMLGYLEHLAKKSIPFETYLDQYVIYMRSEQGLSENTIRSRECILIDFLLLLSQKLVNFNEITPLFIDEILTDKYNTGRYSRRSIQGYASVIRRFLKYSGNMSWCSINLWETIHAPRVYRHEQLPYSPNWDAVKSILASINTDNTTDIRNYAIWLLLTVYGLRSSEVKNLCLDDINWENETLYFKRAKKSKPQIFPLVKIVGDAILRYIKQVRPNNSSLREIFLCRRSPYRPLTCSAIYAIVSLKLRPVVNNIKHYGPHSLRHACATHLINEGVTLKEISDYLGHQGLETTRIYSKVDLTNLRKVADMNWEWLI